MSRRSPSSEEHRVAAPVPDQPPDESVALYGFGERVDAHLAVETRHGAVGPPARAPTSAPGNSNDHLLFVARKEPDGTYSVTLTEEGVQSFETALGIAADLGGNTRISPYSTVANIMERTATRQELSRLLREGGDNLVHRIRVLVLRRKLRGSEKPSGYQATISHIGRALIVGIIGVWALLQFATAIQDIEAIPGILANLPNDILNLHPTSAFSEVGSRISDAGRHVLFGVLGACLTIIVARVIRPLERIYRKDQFLPGERIVLRVVSWALLKAVKGRSD